MKNRLVPAALALIAVPTLLVGLAACSSGGESPKGSDGTKKASLTVFDWDVAHAECMRAEGIDYYKDPVKGSPQAIAVEGDYETFMKADDTCRTKLTEELGERPVSADEKKQDAQLKKENQKVNDCLRKLGYDAPDPEGGATSTSADIPETAYEKCGVSMGPAGK